MKQVAQPPLSEIVGADALAALNRLSRLDWERVNRASNLLALKLAGWEGAELRNEAVVKMLSGDRPWDGMVPVVPFLVMGMKGIISNERKKVRGWAPEDAAASIADPVPSVTEIMEQDEAERALRANVLQSLAHLPNAQAVAMGLLEGLRGTALRAHVGLEAIGYATARRALKRELLRRRR